MVCCYDNTAVREGRTQGRKQQQSSPPPPPPPCLPPLLRVLIACRMLLVLPVVVKIKMRMRMGRGSAERLCMPNEYEVV